MMKKIFISILVSSGLLSFSYSQSEYKDPFEPVLPHEVKAEEEGQEKITSKTEEALLSIVVQGILWGGDFPQVIIDGGVYKSGDRLKDVDAQVFKIEKGTVFISDGEKIYRMKIGKGGEL